MAFASVREGVKTALEVTWVAGRELNLSYDIRETILIINYYIYICIYTHTNYGNLI